MKYQSSNESIPTAKREEINAKILGIIDSNDNQNITHEDIYQAYTGIGGLHGLKFKNFYNYHEYSEAKKEIEQGQFFTPYSICDLLSKILQPQSHELIADLTCGMGNFFNHMPHEANIYGNEIDLASYKVAKYLYPEAHINNEDIRTYEPKLKFDIILGNPPFNLQWGTHENKEYSQNYYCRKAHELLYPGGLLALIVPSSFMSDDFHDGGIIKKMNEMYSFAFQFELPKDCFKSYGVVSFATKLMVFHKRSEHMDHCDYSFNKISTTWDSNLLANMLYKDYIDPIRKQRYENRHQILFESKVTNDNDVKNQNIIKKLLFDIKRNPKLSKHYPIALYKVNQLSVQSKPESMTASEWEYTKLTPKKVINDLRTILSNQHVIEKDEINLVKNKHELYYKAYSYVARQRLEMMEITKRISINDLIIKHSYPFEDKKYKKLIDQKTNSYRLQSKAYSQMDRDMEIDQFLDNIEFCDTLNNQTIKLNDKQKLDVGLVIQKRYAQLSWTQGSGKSLAAIAWYRYLLRASKVNNVFIVSTAMAIHLTWEVILDSYQEDFITISSFSDIERIRPGQIVLLSFERLQKIHYRLKRNIKKSGNKVALVVDESDEISNLNSLRTQAVLNCFRRAKFKLLTTGTSTRNHIAELFPQLELLYNNSVNMLNENKVSYEINKEGKLVEKKEKSYFKPFPPYKKGLEMFKQYFSPKKVTVFGLTKNSQNIYNSSALSDLIAKTTITREYKEIVGIKNYDYINHSVNQSVFEEEVYTKIMEEFNALLHYFKSTDNARKDSILKIIRQINLLIESSSTPHLFKEYTSTLLPTKMIHIMGLVDRFDEQVAIGTVYKKSAHEYYRHLKNKFPSRPIFLITGEVDFKLRLRMIREFQDTRNGILISTQQSLKSSVNIPSCNKIIIESLQWNMPKMDQYCFRFIRYTNTDPKEIHRVTYNRTIEQNLLALLISKEAINKFVKTLEIQDDDDLYEEFDIDTNLLDQLMMMEKDDKGRKYLSWGKQTIQN
ncbi:hypothetical protein PTI45_03072 [Paenibacillus nuruki]|uniref:site-specific DNA-methyltransferase (adenine-specific) n=1 Tax=Paenibacillus nuruki TaxID=1886670 RepID=A0A1E3L3G9_9BACL|nr:N-6 DNA methylase [Paenibacillus nuruki]ODP27510.1 hypothetical protein PTI45_03072 [Paenibacillus nuruki]